MSKALRRSVGARAGWRCDRCGRPTAEDRGQAHHRKLRSRGGGDSLGNLVWLCSRCHGEVHASPALSTAAGFMVPSWGDPAHLPVRRYDGREYLPAGSWERIKEAR